MLTSRLDPATGQELKGWRSLDEAAPYPVYRLGLVRPPLAGGAFQNFVLRHAAWAARAPLLTAQVARVARWHRADAVCICDDETVGWLVPVVRSVLRRRALIYCHGDDLVQENPAARQVRRRWFLAADRIVAASAFAGRQLTEVYGIQQHESPSSPMAWSLARFRPITPPSELSKRLGLAGRRVVLAPARLVPRKGVDQLIVALTAIRERHPEALLLVVGDGPQRAELERMAGTVGGDAAVRFAGAVAAEDMPALYALSEVMALPNRTETGESDGLPLVFLEANACGRPVIGGLAGGTPEAVVNDRNGLLVDGRDAAAIAEAVTRVLDDAALAARLGAGGLMAARASGWEARTQSFLGLCRSA